jgi:uncharacterized protein (DUF58 family)
MRRTTESSPPTRDATGRLSLTGEGLAWLGASLLLGVVGWLKSINLVLIIAYMMATLLVLNGLLARRQVRRVVAARGSAAPAHAGEESILQVTVTNNAERPATVTVEDRAGAEASGWLVYGLGPGASAPCSARLVFPARGRFASSLAVSSAYPLGLVKFERPTAGADLIVLPAVGVADADGLRQWLLRQAGGDSRVRKVLRRVTSDEADVRGVRPYRPGDPIRGIHWRSSARRGELMVREYDAAPSPDLVLVVEPWLPANPTPAAAANLERALSMAATVALTWSRAFGARVTLGVAGDPASVRTTGPADTAVREALAPLADVAGGEKFGALGPDAFDRALLRAVRVVVSSRARSPYAAVLTRSTGRPFVALSPADRVPWYQPPVIGSRSQRTEARSQKSEED